MPRSSPATLPLALTLGEPAGIGPDIAIAAWRRRVELALPPFYLIADPAFVARRAERLGLSLPIRSVAPGEAAGVFATALPVVALDLAITAEPGRPDATSAPAAIAAIRRAVADVIAGDASAVVTNPVAKNVLYRSGFAEPGHTEFLARLAAEATGVAAQPVMMLWSPELAVVPVTIHLPLAEVPGRLDRELIVEHRPHRRRATCASASASRGRASRSPASIRMPARTARSARRISPSSSRRSIA